MDVSSKPTFWSKGEPYIWLTGGALSLTGVLVALLLGVILLHGLRAFWPREVALLQLTDDRQVMGEIVGEAPARSGLPPQFQVKVGNRELYGADFRWIDQDKVTSRNYPDRALVVERLENGNFIGYLKEVRVKTLEVPASGTPTEQLADAVAASRKARRDIDRLDKRIAHINDRQEYLDGRLLKYRYKGYGDDHAAVQKVLTEKEQLSGDYEGLVGKMEQQVSRLEQNVVVLTEVQGNRDVELELTDIVRYDYPNALGLGGKIGYYLSRWKELLVDEPRESNTEGGLFPAIFGTVMMIFLMSILSFPFGVITAVYMTEYAREGMLVRIVRIAVNNLAGIPSIVYGIFGLSFFVYGIGHWIDLTFFPERPANHPTFGTGGILWASLTLGILTLPVVIVSTEEALRTIPQSLKESSYALGATKFQTLTKVLLPMASPGIMTGFILAMARAAGEVAPLMITGVVKLAPALPLDSQFPFVHLDRKFMHLGFHIYDVGFQSPNVEAAKPMVYVTTLLLLAIVISMSAMAIYLRNKMRRRFRVQTL